MAQSQDSEKSSWYKAMRNFKWGIISKISTAFIAKVVKYDSKKHVADILPLANSSSGEVSAQYLDVPVVTSCYILDEEFERYKSDFEAIDANSRIPAHPGAPAHQHTHMVEHMPKKKFMRPGVPVVCVVLDRDNDNWKGGRTANTYTPNSSRLHDANDAVIVGVLGGDAVNG